MLAKCETRCNEKFVIKEKGQSERQQYNAQDKDCPLQKELTSKQKRGSSNSSPGHQRTVVDKK